MADTFEINRNFVNSIKQDGFIEGLAAKESNLLFVIKISGITALGGLLFGYDTAVIAGAIGFLEKKFHLSPMMVGWVASSAIWGCILGVLIAAPVSSYYGRKKALIATALIFALSGIASALPNDLTSFIIARLLGGIAIGAVSVLAPMFIAETAPPRVRGRMVTLYQLAIVIGINLIYYVNMKIAASGDESWNVEMGWRLMLGSETLPALLFMALLFFVPESPRWLITRNRHADALAVLEKINGTHRAKLELKAIRNSISEKTSSYRELLTRHFRIPLVVGFMLALFSQITGINAIIYYAPEILKATGSATESAFMQTFLIGIVNTVFTIVALVFVDFYGRRKLLLYGVAIMFVCLVGITTCFSTGYTSGPWLLVFILGYIAAFAWSLGPIPWIIISEIFPNSLRALAMSLATLILWVGVVLVTQWTPVLLKELGATWLFAIFSINTAAFFLFALFKVPETKNMSLEEIEKLWTNKV